MTDNVFKVLKEGFKENLEEWRARKVPLICYLFFIRIHPILLAVICLPFLFNYWFFGGDLEKTQRALTIIVYLMLHALIAEFFAPHNIRIIKDYIKDIKEQRKASKTSQSEVQND